MKNQIIIFFLLLLLSAGCKQTSKPEVSIDESTRVSDSLAMAARIKAYQDSLKADVASKETPPRQETKKNMRVDSLKGKFGLIPRTWINLDPNGQFRSKPWFGTDYIYFDHAFIHDSEHPMADPGLKDDVYLVSSPEMIDAWNFAIRDTSIDNTKLEVGMCSGIERENNMNIFKKAALYYEGKQVYPNASVCRCYAGCN